MAGGARRAVAVAVAMAMAMAIAGGRQVLLLEDAAAGAVLVAARVPLLLRVSHRAGVVAIAVGLRWTYTTHLQIQKGEKYANEQR